MEDPSTAFNKVIQNRNSHEARRQKASHKVKQNSHNQKHRDTEQFFHKQSSVSIGNHTQLDAMRLDSPGKG